MKLTSYLTIPGCYAFIKNSAKVIIELSYIIIEKLLQSVIPEVCNINCVTQSYQGAVP